MAPSGHGPCAPTTDASDPRGLGAPSLGLAVHAPCWPRTLPAVHTLHNSMSTAPCCCARTNTHMCAHTRISVHTQAPTTCTHAYAPVCTGACTHTHPHPWLPAATQERLGPLGVGALLCVCVCQDPLTCLWSGRAGVTLVSHTMPFSPPPPRTRSRRSPSGCRATPGRWLSWRAGTSRA